MLRAGRGEQIVKGKRREGNVNHSKGVRGKQDTYAWTGKGAGCLPAREKREGTQEFDVAKGEGASRQRSRRSWGKKRKREIETLRGLPCLAKEGKRRGCQAHRCYAHRKKEEESRHALLRRKKTWNRR